jgi:chemotaxis protein histidine kinase CheA
MPNQWASIITDAMRREYAAELPGEAARLRAAMAGFERAPSLLSARALRQPVHHVAGTALCFGFDELGALAKECDALLQAMEAGDEPLPPPDVAQARALCQQIDGLLIQAVKKTLAMR